METKMDSEHISLINYRKEENAKKEHNYPIIRR